MTETAKKIHIELKGGESGITSFAGLWPAVELFRKSGLPEVIDSAVGARTSRGFRDSDHILSLILLHLAGGSASDHLPFLKEKLSFGKLGISVPSPSAVRKWLNEFHNCEEDGKRGMGKAFIPEENGYLKGLGTVLTRLFAFAVKSAPRKHITLDQDATFIETEESGANWNYKGEKSYQALNTYCPEYDLAAGTRYGDGNVPPGWKQKEELERILESLPEEVKGVSLRSAGAGYRTDLLTWCTEGKHERFGYIPVGISCPVGEEFKKAVRAVPEEDWKPLGKERGGKQEEKASVQEWAEIVYVPAGLGRKKHGRDYRFLAVRERWDGRFPPEKEREEEGKGDSSLPGEQLYFTEAIRHLEEEVPGVKKLHLLEPGGRIYKTFGIVTNIEDGADGELSLYFRERTCGFREKAGCCGPLRSDVSYQRKEGKQPDIPKEDSFMPAVKIADRFSSLQPSSMIKIFQAASAVEDLTDLSFGEPDFHTEPEIVDAAAKAAREGCTHYPPLQGFEDLRKEIAAYWKRHHGLETDPADILLTVGGLQASHLCFQAMLNPGDEVLVAEPCFSAYFQQVENNGGVVVAVPSREENGFFPTAEDFAKAVTPRTKILVINSPCNPTGAVLTMDQALEIAAVAKKYDLFVISDEIYEAFIYSGKHIPLSSLPGMKERTMTVGGFSKSHCMTGWRIGYAMGPAELLKVMATLSVSQTFGVNTLAQKGGAFALATQDEKVKARTAEFEKRVRYCAGRLNAMPGVSCPEARGAFYLFPDISGTGMTDEEFAWWLLEAGKVAVIPGTAFGKSGAGHIRIACTLSMEDLGKAMDRMEEALKKRS